MRQCVLRDSSVQIQKAVRSDLTQTLLLTFRLQVRYTLLHSAPYYSGYYQYPVKQIQVFQTVDRLLMIYFSLKKKKQLNYYNKYYK